MRNPTATPHTTTQASDLSTCRTSVSVRVATVVAEVLDAIEAIKERLPVSISLGLTVLTFLFTMTTVPVDAVVYHGLPLLEVLEKAGLDTRSMAGQRKVAPAIVVVTARDGYTVAFSVGELLMHRADPRVFLVAESAAGPLPENEGPVRLFVQGDRVRSPYALKTVELRYVAKNAAAEPKK